MEGAFSKLEKLSSLPRVDKKTGIFTDDADEAYATVDVLCKLFDVNSHSVRTVVQEMDPLDVIGRNGRETGAFKVSEVKKRLHK